MKTIIQIVLTLAILALIYFLYESIMEPIRFKNLKEKRDAAVIEKLKKIRDVQMAYKNNYGRYTASFDTLTYFVKHDVLKMVKKIGDIPDSVSEKIPNRKDQEKFCLEKGIIKRDTIEIPVKDSLFAKNYPIDSLSYVPNTNGKHKFAMNAGQLQTQSKVIVPVFEVSVLFDQYLEGLERQLVVNLNVENEQNKKFKGLKVGSMEDPSTNGNWE